LSPNLFLLVADIPQVLIKTDGGIRHPMADGPCPVLQYTNDTIILVKVELGDITRLKKLLDMFSSATRLAINYDKSTITPLHLKDGALDLFLEILHCKVGTFPQTYLGLPLSNLNLQLFDFVPLFAKWTGTWQAGRRCCCLLQVTSFSSTHCSPEYQPMPWG
jgi:hypothetical protein